MKIQEVRELIKLIDKSTIDEFEYELNGEKIALKKRESVVGQPASTPTFEEQALFTEPAHVDKEPVERQEPQSSEKTVPVGQQDKNIHKIKSPMVGTFYTAPSPEEGSFVKIGDNVKSDTVVCIVEAMKLFNEIEADREGELVEILAEDGQLVEYGQPLFLLRTES